MVIVGGGGHGLATAYYLAKEHGITNVAVLEKGWIGGGNTGRNTTIVRSNYLWDESTHLYEKSMKLWEGLVAGPELQRDVQPARRAEPRPLAAGHARHRAPRQRQPAQRRRRRDPRRGAGEGDGAVHQHSPNARYPILGASLQRRGGVARHDAVAWGFARGADARGVDIIQNCEVTGIRREGGRGGRRGDHPRLHQGAKKVGVVAAGHSSVLAVMAGLRLPIESHPLQALVSEPIKPVLHTVVMSNAVHGYISQSDKGDLVIGAGIDDYAGYGQRGSFSRHREHARGDRRAVPDLQPRAHEPPVGRHRRRLPRRLPDHRHDAGQGPLHQLRLGHRRLQGHAGLGLGVRAHRSRRTGRTS